MKFLKKLFGHHGANGEPAQKSTEFVFGVTDVGKQRANNEDYFLASPKKNLHIVADGMGGHNAGEVASMNAAEEVNLHLSSELLSRIEDDTERIGAELKASLLDASDKLLEMAREETAYQGMGCTIVVALICGNTLHLCHVGDARAYICNGDSINLLTTDHSKVMSLVEAGQMTIEEARKSPLKNELSQAIGSPVQIAPDYANYSLKEEEKIMLCSDGLWDMLSDDDIFEILRQDKPVKILCEELVAMANEAGGHDNITVVVIEHRINRQA